MLRSTMLRIKPKTGHVSLRRRSSPAPLPPSALSFPRVAAASQRIPLLLRAESSVWESRSSGQSTVPKPEPWGRAISQSCVTSEFRSSFHCVSSLHSAFHLRAVVSPCCFGIGLPFQGRVVLHCSSILVSAFSSAPSSPGKARSTSVGAERKKKKTGTKKGQVNVVVKTGSPTSPENPSLPLAKSSPKGRKKKTNMVVSEIQNPNVYSHFSPVGASKPPPTHCSPLETLDYQASVKDLNSMGALDSVLKNPHLNGLLDPNSNYLGGIHVILGPMFAGKTTALIKRMQDIVKLGKNVVIVKSCLDTRYAQSEIVSHDGARMPCIPVSSLHEFRQMIGEEAYNQIDVIGIDEAQFIQDLVPFSIHAADHEKKTIIAAGLDGDFLRRKFGGLVDLIPVCESVTKLSSRCEVCGGKAVFTLRKSAALETTLVGGSDLYMPVCRDHYVKGQIAIRTASLIVDEHNSALQQSSSQEDGNTQCSVAIKKEG